MKSNRFRLLLTVTIAFIVTVSLVPAHAQDESDRLAIVHVTTQDFASLRLLPGRQWERLATIPPATTIRATGRSADGQWVQLAYDGSLDDGVTTTAATLDGITYGWTATWLLVWTGDILRLPIDGVRTVPIARQSNDRILLTPETRYYRDFVDPSTQVTNTLTEPLEVELTGRLGSPDSGFFWLQFRLDDEFFWTATWEVGEPRRSRDLLDGQSVFPFGRLLTQLRDSRRDNSATLNSIARRWRDLDAGFETTCNDIPEHADNPTIFFTDGDLSVEPLYLAPVNSLFNAITHTNDIIARFEDVCTRPLDSRFATAEDVRNALDIINRAEQEFQVVGLFLNSLDRRNPLLGN